MPSSSPVSRRPPRAALYPAWGQRKQAFLRQLQQFFFTEVLQLRRGDPPNQTLRSGSYRSDNNPWGPRRIRSYRRLRHCRAGERRAPDKRGFLLLRRVLPFIPALVLASLALLAFTGPRQAAAEGTAHPDPSVVRQIHRFQR